jgi:hypothetical protein
LQTGNRDNAHGAHHLGRLDGGLFAGGKQHGTNAKGGRSNQLGMSHRKSWIRFIISDKANSGPIADIDQ